MPHDAKACRKKKQNGRQKNKMAEKPTSLPEVWGWKNPGSGVTKLIINQTHVDERII